MNINASTATTRRNFVKAGAGLAATIPVMLTGGRSASAQQGRPTEVNALQDPRDQYPSPPFPRQPQEWPGLTSRMDPVPDHGERSYQGSDRLLGRKALITGGDSGIGRAAAIAFAREGADVAINYLPFEEPDAEEVVQLISSEGRNAVAIPGDLQDEQFCSSLVQQAVEGLGGLDILVNNAARQTHQSSIEDITTEQFDSTFKTNVYAMFWITKAALPHLPAGACIINTSSIQAFDPSPGLLDYAQTKACMVTFTKSLAKQLADRGIRVNAIAPGPFWTPLQPTGGQPQDAVVEFGSSSPFGRPGQPAEIAPLYVLLASSEASYSTGEVYSATGGTMPY